MLIHPWDVTINGRHQSRSPVDIFQPLLAAESYRKGLAVYHGQYEGYGKKEIIVETIVARGGTLLHSCDDLEG